MNDLGIPTSGQEMRFLTNAIYYQTLVGLLLSLLLILSSSLLIYGVKKEHEKLFLPALILWPIDSFVRCIFCIVLSVKFGFLHPLIMMLNFIFLVVLVMNVFIWLCVYSHWKQLKSQAVGQNNIGMSKV